MATYDCDAGFVLDLSLGGSEMRTCVDDDGLDAIGVFDTKEPRCVRKCIQNNVCVRKLIKVTVNRLLIIIHELDLVIVSS